MIKPTLNLVSKAYEGFQNGAPPMASFSRASGAWRTNEKGSLEYTPNQIARHDYSPSGEYLGWLLEGPSTNFLLYSSQSDNAAWFKAGGTVTPNTGTAPDGSISADTFTSSSADASMGQGFTPTSVATYTASVWLRVTSGTRMVKIVLRRLSPWTDITAIDAQLTTTWKRFSVTGVALDTTAHQFCIGTWSTLPSGTSIEIWGGQIERSPFSSSYISTGGIAASRAADIFSLPVNSSLFSVSGGGTLYIVRDVSGYKNYGVSPQLDDGTGSSVVQIASSTSLSGVYGWSYSSTGGAYGTAGTGYPVATETRCALAFSSNDQSMTMAVNGAIAGSAPMKGHTLFTTLRITGDTGGNYLDGHVRHLALFPRPFSTTDLQLLTL